MLREFNNVENEMMNNFYEALDKILKSGSYELIAHLYGDMDYLKYEVENVFEPMFKERRKRKGLKA